MRRCNVRATQGDVMRFTRRYRSTLFFASGSDKCCADATGRVDIATRCYWRQAAAGE